jgi:hypothetical protein
LMKFVQHFSCTSYPDPLGCVLVIKIFIKRKKKKEEEKVYFVQHFSLLRTYPF